jgi:carbonic anhydrase
MNLDAESMLKSFALVLAAAALTLVLPARAAEDQHWSYAVPAEWADVSPTCAVGGHQSPIALSTADATRSKQKLRFAWTKSTGELVDTGHTFQVNVPPGNAITYGGTRYELVQFHFHTPSEHTLDGWTAPMEVHFVHRSAEGKLAVVAVLLQHGSAASPFAPVLAALPAAGEKRAVSVDLPALVPADRRHFAYSGSLTTPPCSEEVQWIVMRAEEELPVKAVDAFKARYAENARPVQPRQGRTVELAQ